MLQSLDPSHFTQLPTPNAHWVLQEAGQTLACCSLWWNSFHQTFDPKGQAIPGQNPQTEASPDRIGTIGHLKATCPQAALTLLNHACDELRQRGCTLALGPMDGTTWHAYRCATDWRNGPPFWGEPTLDPSWVDWFTQAGFTPVMTYESRLCTNLRQTWPPRRRRHRLPPISLGSAQGIDPADLLPQIYPLVMASFRRQPFFQPLPQEVFYQHYRPLLSHLDPRLVQLAWASDGSALTLPDKKLVGLVLSMPDQLAPTDPPRLIIKTLAILPDRAYAGLGYSLLEAAHQAAAQQGYTQAIHALMHRNNVSLNLSRRYSQPFREYMLMGKRLG